MPRLLATVPSVALRSVLAGASALVGTCLTEDAFQCDILAVHDTQPGQEPVLGFSVTDPTNGNAAHDIEAPGSGAVAIEGGRHFAITGAAPVARRTVVDSDRCTACHQPHPSLRGRNRTDEPRVCAMCHNPNQPDIAYRTAGNEAPVAFEFPGTPSNCLDCHVDGTSELPRGPGVLGTTVATGSTYATATDPKAVGGDVMNDAGEDLERPGARRASPAPDPATRPVARRGGAPGDGASGPRPAFACA